MRTLGLGRFSSIWYANMERYVRRHHGTGGWLLLKGLIAAGMSARIAISLLRGDARAGAGLCGRAEADRHQMARVESRR